MAEPLSGSLEKVPKELLLMNGSLFSAAQPCEDANGFEALISLCFGRYLGALKRDCSCDSFSWFAVVWSAQVL